MAARTHLLVWRRTAGNFREIRRTYT